MPRPSSEPSLANFETALFGHYLRTGQHLHGEAAERFLELKFNPYHDPDDGRFTFATGSGHLAAKAPYPIRIELPTSKPSYPIRIELPSPRSPTIGRQGEATQGQPVRARRWQPKDPSVIIPAPVSIKLDGVADDFHLQTGRSLTVTDGARIPAIQAIRMHNKYTQGDFRTYAGPTGRRIEAVWRRSVALNQSRSETLAAMTAVIGSEQAHGRLVSKHLAGRGADFSVRGMSRAEIQTLMTIITKHGGRPLWEGIPRHIHASF